MIDPSVADWKSDVTSECVIRYGELNESKGGVLFWNPWIGECCYKQEEIKKSCSVIVGGSMMPLHQSWRAFFSSVDQYSTFGGGNFQHRHGDT